MPRQWLLVCVAITAVSVLLSFGYAALSEWARYVGLQPWFSISVAAVTVGFIVRLGWKQAG